MGLTTVNSSIAADPEDAGAMLAATLESLGVPGAASLVDIFQPQVEAAERLSATAEEYADLAEDTGLTGGGRRWLTGTPPDGAPRSRPWLPPKASP